MTPSQKNEKALAALRYALLPNQKAYEVRDTIQEAISTLSQPTTGEDCREAFEETVKRNGSGLDLEHCKYEGENEYVSSSTERAYEVWCDAWKRALLTTRAEVERFSSNFNWLRKLDMSLCPEPNGEWSVLDSKNERAYFGKTPEMAIEEARHALEKGE